ncbi:MAG TPA: SPOR domain-containing protein [Bryobacteraceae bacterium]|nr:SPOR domain-containing protein [Bryobacteraceae bacterium]
MLRTDESETEILLGNKQLFGIFIVVALLLGIAFTGGYMVGRGSAPKKATETPAGPSQPAATNSAATPTGGETHSVPAAGSDTNSQTPVPEAAPQTQEPPLGSRKHKALTRTQPPEDLHTAAAEEYTPQAGKTYLQVAAVSRDEAFGIADVLRHKGFRAHAVPSPHNAKLYRVIVGPMRDAGDLSNTRDSLRTTAGFRDVFVQRY